MLKTTYCLCISGAGRKDITPSHCVRGHAVSRSRGVLAEGQRIHAGAAGQQRFPVHPDAHPDLEK